MTLAPGQATKPEIRAVPDPLRGDVQAQLPLAGDLIDPDLIASRSTGGCQNDITVTRGHGARQPESGAAPTDRGFSVVPFVGDPGVVPASSGSFLIAT